MKRKERLRYYSLYTVIFAVLSFLVFFIFIKNGRSFVYESNGEDGIAQHYICLLYTSSRKFQIYTDTVGQITGCGKQLI